MLRFVGQLLDGLDGCVLLAQARDLIRKLLELRASKPALLRQRIDRRLELLNTLFPKGFDRKGKGYVT